MTLVRCGNKWTVNELLQLQREYELLSLDINDIAKIHSRSWKAIAFKLASEGFEQKPLINYKKINRVSTNTRTGMTTRSKS